MTLQDSAAAMTVNGITVEAIEKGRGRPLLFLHPGIGLDRNAAVIDKLAEHARVIAPSHPGFGNSEQPKSFTTIDDLAYFYLDLIDRLDLKDTIVVGVSLGAWIAAEIAIKSTARLSHLVLANAVGIKVGARDMRDIVDIFAITEPDVRIVARNREASARYGWSPYMHDAKLKGRLHRIRIPTLFLWGSADRILTEDYGRAYCAAIPGARFETIARAGHYPHIEQPDAFARAVFAFTQGQAK